MARPFKEGLDYFPLDVDFLEDKKVKLIKSEFGAKGILILISLLALVYKNNGYFYKWDNDDCYLMSDGVGCGCSPELIQEVLQGCIRRSIFDDGVFNAFDVLTSKGIQQRYIKAVTERRNINIYKEYWLIDLSAEKGLSTGILNKITFNSINPPNNSVNLPNNSVNPSINSESKVKESKVKNKDICGTSPPTPKFIPPTLEEITAYCKQRNNGVDPVRWFNFYAAKGWMIGKNKMKDWKRAVMTWERSSSYAGNIGSSGKAQTSKYDTSKLVNTPTPGVVGDEQVDF